MHTPVNTFEIVARARKVLALASRVPLGTTKHANISAAILLRSWNTAQRATFATFAGVRIPSNRTWNMFCDFVAVRPI